MLFESIINLQLSTVKTLNAISVLVGILLIFWAIFWNIIGIDSFQPNLKGFIKYSFFLIISFGPVWPYFDVRNLLDHEVETYSQEKLGDLYLTSNGKLYKKDPIMEKNLANGAVTFKNSSDSKYIGIIDCKTLSFKLCVETIKQHKIEIVSKIESSGTYTVNE